MPVSTFKYLQNSEELSQHLSKLRKIETELHNCDTFLSSQITRQVVASTDILKLVCLKLRIRGQPTGAQQKLKNPLQQDDLFSSELWSAVRAEVQNQGDKLDKEADAAKGYTEVLERGLHLKSCRNPYSALVLDLYMHRLYMPLTSSWVFPSIPQQNLTGMYVAHTSAPSLPVV